mmetsp:Transcript_99427/g.148889  ORF Transcript_99427/g.148889 Transcript_99427/m.148889 type:complete len:96 (-) Transcript_99427:165-452(-)
MERYKTCDGRFEKTCCFMDVVKTIQESNGRFIERRPSGWEVVDDTVAREKIANGFRFKLIKGGENASAKQTNAPAALSPSAMRAPKRSRKNDCDL